MHVDYEKLGPVMRNFGDDDVVHVEYEKHGLVVSDLGDDAVFHVELQETWLGWVNSAVPCQK